MTAITTMMEQMGRDARLASRELAKATAERKHAALIGAAEALWAQREAILAANAKDLVAADEKGLSGSMRDRLALDEDRLRGIIDAVRNVAEIADPVGEVMEEWTAPAGFNIQRVRTPIGVIGIIFESRPNVTADAAALCIKSGNAAILRGGSESFHSSRAIHAAMAEGIRKAGLPETAIQLVQTTDRAAVKALLQLTESVDVIVPRGGKSLVGLVQKEARVPVFAHLEGIVHVYVDGSADDAKAEAVVLNAKTRRTSICGAAETLLIDRAYWDKGGRALIEALVAKGVEIRGDAEIAKLSGIVAAKDEDFGCEFLDSIIAARLVDGIDGAIAHINTHHSQHTDAVIAEDAAVVTRFFNEIDSAILMHNTSTQFADGGEFGLGAEIGIATGKLHARGPVGATQLTSFKYLVRGSGHTRP